MASSRPKRRTMRRSSSQQIGCILGVWARFAARQSADAVCRSSVGTSQVENAPATCKSPISRSLTDIVGSLFSLRAMRGCVQWLISSRSRRGCEVPPIEHVRPLQPSRNPLPRFRRPRSEPFDVASCTSLKFENVGIVSCHRIPSETFQTGFEFLYQFIGAIWELSREQVSLLSCCGINCRPSH